MHKMRPVEACAPQKIRKALFPLGIEVRMKDLPLHVSRGILFRHATPFSLHFRPFPSPAGRYPTPAVGDPFKSCSEGGESVSTQTNRLVLGARGKASAGRRRYTVVYGFALSALCLGRGFGQRQAGDLPRLASEGFPVTLAMEIKAARETPSSRAASGTDLQDGARESHVGRRAYRC